MSEHTLTIIQESGQTFTISSTENMRVLTFLPQSPFYRVQYEIVDGRDGEIETGGQFEGRIIPARIFFRSYDIFDFYLLRDQIFRLFHSKEQFYLISSRQPGKRWYARVNSTYEIEPKGGGTYGIFDIQFKSASTYCESIGTTLDQMTFDSGLWQIGQGLIGEDLVYRHNTSRFRIYNAGDIDIDPCQLPLIIRAYGVTNELKIINTTTGDEWQYNGTTGASDVITLDGVRALKNGESIFGQTNFKLINIAKGWNDFLIEGINGPFQIEFDFRFYYF